MAKTQSSITGFNSGEITGNLAARVDLDVYGFAANLVENWQILAQGPVQQRRGFFRVAELTGVTDGTKVKLKSHRFQQTQDYLHVWYGQNLSIFNDNAQVATLSHTYTASDIKSLRFTQIKDTTIIVHPKYKQRELLRVDGDTFWQLQDITFETLPFAKFNFSQNITPSALTAGASITLTLNGTVGYWNAGHASTAVQIKVRGKLVTLGSGAPNNATGGIALSSAGTAANAFDSTPATTCAAGAPTRWVGYNFAGTATVIRLVGVNIDTSGTYDLSFEADNDDSFPSPTVIRTVTSQALTAGTTQWYTIPAYVAESRFRVKCTTSSVGSFTVRDLYFRKGLVINGTIGSVAIPTAGSTSDWQEQGWSDALGYPRTATAYANRLVFGGIDTQPDVMYGRVDSDLYNFAAVTNTDGVTVVQTDGWTFKIASQRSQFIRNIIPNRDGILILASDGEFFATGSNGTITPLNPPNVQLQSDNGTADLIMSELDGALLYITANGKSVMSMDFDYLNNNYTSEKLTVFAAHLFDDNAQPVGITAFRGYLDHQSSYIFVPRSDGTLCVCTYDPKRKVLAWARWTTWNQDGTQAKFRDAEVVYVNQNGIAVPTLYVVVERVINGVTKVYVERLGVEDVCLDGCLSGYSASPATTWGGLTQYANTNVTVYGGMNQGRVDYVIRMSVAVNGSGQITLPYAVNQIYVGQPYSRYLETLPPIVKGPAGYIKGHNVRFKEVTAGIDNGTDLVVNGYRFDDFRTFGVSQFGAPLDRITGDVRQLIGNRDDNPRDPRLLVTARGPVPITLKSIHTELVVEF